MVYLIKATFVFANKIKISFTFLSQISKTINHKAKDISNLTILQNLKAKHALLELMETFIEWLFLVYREPLTANV